MHNSNSCREFQEEEGKVRCWNRSINSPNLDRQQRFFATRTAALANVAASLTRTWQLCFEGEREGGEGRGWLSLGRFGFIPFGLGLLPHRPPVRDNEGECVGRG